jgi:hypothetical protein
MPHSLDKNVVSFLWLAILEVCPPGEGAVFRSANASQLEERTLL